MSRLLSAAAVAVALGLGGCGPTGCEVSGDVTAGGKPLVEGSINFVPESGASMSAAAPVRDGRFAITGDKQLAPGAYKVRIYPPAFGSTAPPPAVPFSVFTTKVDIPPGKSECKFDVPPGTK